MSINTYERAEAVLEHEHIDEFLCHLACQMMERPEDERLGLALTKFLIAQGFTEKLSKVKRTYR